MSNVPPRFLTDYGKRVAKCQKCKMQMEKGSLRLAKVMPNFFIKPKDDKPPPDMKQYFHVNCLFEMLFKARATTKVIDTTEEIEGFDDLNAEDQDTISKLVDELAEKRSRDGDEKPAKTPKKAAAPKDDKSAEKKNTPESSSSSSRKRKNEDSGGEAAKRGKKEEPKEIDESSTFNSFYKFTKVCEVISDVSDKKEKSAVVISLLEKKGFDGDLVCWLKFLMRDTDEKDYKVNDEKLIGFFAKILDVEEADLKKHFKKSQDISATVREFTEKVRKNEKSDWSIQKVDRFLTKLATLEEDEQIMTHFKVAAKRMSPVELQYVVRLALKDLRINVTNKIILKGIHYKAPEAFEDDGDSIETIVKKYYDGSFDKKEKSKEKEKKSSHKSKSSISSSKKYDSDSGDSDEDMSESEDSYESDDDDDEDDGDSDELSEDHSSDDDVSSSSESEGEDGALKENQEKAKAPRGTRSRPAGGNAEKKHEVEECPEDMEPCRYGAKCYRKNAEHKREFWHPAK